MQRDHYVDLAIQGVTSILERELAVVWPEVEARASERPWGNLPHRIDPHHLTTAKHVMLNDGLLISEAAPTRGGKWVEVYYLVSAPKRAAERAGARKRLLHARFLGWAMGTQRHPRGLIGGAGEAVTHSSLEAAAPAGYRLLRTGGDVGVLFGEEVPGGPLDNAAHLLTMEDAVPGPAVTVLIEVKNLREWLYPQAPELYQLLSKAAQLQVAHPGSLFLPVLVCRRGHPTLFKMAKRFGFYVIPTSRQYIAASADVTNEALTEVRSDLGFADLVTADGADPRIVKQFTTSLPKQAVRFAKRWADVAPELVEEFTLLRTAMDPPARGDAMRRLRQLARERVGDAGGW